MSLLRTHSLGDLVPINDEQRLMPGGLVTDAHDSQARGMVVAMKTPEGVSVLWSKPPFYATIDIQRQPINAKPKLLRARWSAEPEKTRVYYGKSYGKSSQMFEASVPMPTFIGEEEYTWPSDMTTDDLERFMEELRDDLQADHIELCTDGTMTVKRRTQHMPEYMRNHDGSFRSHYP